ncbi:unnamed protein product [Arabidopsis halleri]
MAIKQGDESTLIPWVPDESTPISILAKMKLYLQNPSTRTIFFKTIKIGEAKTPSTCPPPKAAGITRSPYRLLQTILSLQGLHLMAARNQLITQDEGTSLYLIYLSLR